ncbi:unnamed protein product [Periconia digitata]|uniref:Uncharacterized protein n=1 Tax=Periconia digitata TaxID=1303443 RepID=A0A9W4UD73_9PLEO|nr:unnamed protein product [Periconia digitata]
MSSPNSYFIPGYGISRAVMQNDIHYYCGPDAIVRPYTHHGRDGFLVTTVGPALTQVSYLFQLSIRLYTFAVKPLHPSSSAFLPPYTFTKHNFPHTISCIISFPHTFPYVPRNLYVLHIKPPQPSCTIPTRF